MNKNTLIIVAIALVLLLGGGAFMMMNKSASTDGTGSNTSGFKSTTGGSNTASKSLKDLIMGGVAQKCTFSASGTTGESYVSGGKMRSDYSTTAGGNTVAGHMIVDGTTSYMWMDGQQTGYKMTYDVNEADVPEAPEGQGQQGLDVNQMMDYTCTPWVANGSMFSPPADVTFTDFSAMMPSAGTGTAPAAGNAMPNACAACDSLSGESKTQCLTALNCN